MSSLVLYAMSIEWSATAGTKRSTKGASVTLAEEVLKLSGRLLSLLGVQFDEAMRPHYYEIDNVKRWVLGDGGEAGNCEGCIANSEMGWILDDEIFSDGGYDVDGPPLHPNDTCELEYGERRRRVYLD